MTQQVPVNSNTLRKKKKVKSTCESIFTAHSTINNTVYSSSSPTTTCSIDDDSTANHIATTITTTNNNGLAHACVFDDYDVSSQHSLDNGGVVEIDRTSNLVSIQHEFNTMLKSYGNQELEFGDLINLVFMTSEVIVELQNSVFEINKLKRKREEEESELNDFDEI